MIIFYIIILTKIMKVIKPMKMRCAGNVAWIEEIRNACKILVGKPEGKNPFARSRGK
jgi:hypothetical protein